MNLGMLKLFKYILFFLLVQNLHAGSSNLDFDFIKKGKQDNNTLLLIGGIQGDEPGGFMAASLIATHYKITKGSVWVIPNLNFYSIIKRDRGPYGDMNRKFANISPNDPDYESIQKIKSYIRSKEVKLVLNLHDGSGFYRKKHTNNIYSPLRWGQSAIIDQSEIDVKYYGNLEEIAQEVCNSINKRLLKKNHHYQVKNTNTKLGDKEMEKSLTYYSINNKKAAFANEASKELPLDERTYYHLLAIEKYMDIMGIEYKRSFDLTSQSVYNAIEKDIYISFYNKKIQLPLSNIRRNLGYFPLKKDGKLEFNTSTPLLTVIKNDSDYAIHYGNRKLAVLNADYFEHENINQDIRLSIDNEDLLVPLGSIVNVKKTFRIEPAKGIRVNIIGFVSKKRNESNIDISKKDILKRFSIDKKGNIFRVEFYKNEKFAGMILVNFDKDNSSTRLSLFNKKYYSSTNSL